MQAIDPEPGSEAWTRRGFLQAGGAAASGLAGPVAAQPAPGAAPRADAVSPLRRPVQLRVNGQLHELHIEPRVTLLDALREELALTGTKKGCNRGQCGACTVLVDGRRIHSCLALAVMQEGASITTIEGLGTPARLHPMQEAFAVHDAFQCGYCTPGQICSAVALLDEARAGQWSVVAFERGARPGAVTLDEAEVRERMSGNLCRCGAYNNIVRAVQAVAGTAVGGSA